MSIIERLTENLVTRDLRKEGDALLQKWEATGLLEGLESDRSKESMSMLLENQAKELLREASSMAGGDVEGFAAVAFPIVRRVFGGLIANQLVSVQPMSLPSGLLFFMDFTYGSHQGNIDGAEGATDQVPWRKGDSLYGGGKVASDITAGVVMTGSLVDQSPGGFYDLQTGYASPTASIASATTAVGTSLFTAQVAISALTDAQKVALRYDPDILALDGTDYTIAAIEVTPTAASMLNLNTDALHLVNLVTNTTGAPLDTATSVIRRLTHTGINAASGQRGDRTATATKVTCYLLGDGAMTAANAAGVATTYIHPVKDKFTTADAIGGVKGADPWGLEGSSNANSSFNDRSAGIMKEIDIKVDSVSVTAQTKKLKAKWSPELGQDLNAYHNMDAEVELTSILSEQIALEIDREILNDLVQGAKAATHFWSRSPGLFVNRATGAEIGATSAAPDFTGTVSEWYETLLETINDVSAQIHRKTLRGGANFVVTSPEVASIMEMTSGFRASVAVDGDTGSAGAVKSGSVNKKWDVYIDPYFPRNVILVGRKGGSFLESGYVYAPYVPLQVTPTIFGVEDFVPRKGVMTRYAKKMVRPDMYGLVIVRGLLGEAGA